VTAVTSYQYVPGWIIPPPPTEKVGAETTVVGRVKAVKIALDTSHLVVATPPAPLHAAPATDAPAAYRLSTYGGPVVVAHHVTGLVTAVPEAYAPAVPPLQPVNEVAVVPVHVTVPDEPNEIVFVPALKRCVPATGTVAFGRVTLELKVVPGADGQ